jgi:hypothetical protein
LKVTLRVNVKPSAGLDHIQGFGGDGSLKVQLKAPPERGKANQGLIRLLSRRTGLPRESIRIVSGATSRKKVVAFEGLGEEDLRRALA